MGCCSINHSYSQQLYIIRYGSEVSNRNQYTIDRIQVFQQQLQQLKVMQNEVKKIVSMTEFTTEEYIQTCQIVLENYLKTISQLNQSQSLNDDTTQLHIEVMKTFLRNLATINSLKNDSFDVWVNEFLVILIQSEQNIGMLGQYATRIKNDRNLTTIFFTLNQLTDEQFIKNEQWLQEQFEFLKERLLNFQQQVIINFSNEFLNQLDPTQLYEQLYQLKSSLSLQQIEYLGFSLLQQIIDLKNMTSYQLSWKDKFIELSYLLEQQFNQLYTDNIISVIKLLMDDYLVQQEIQLASLIIIQKGFKMKKLEIFDDSFFNFHMHQAEKSINQIKCMAYSFETYFTKYQISQLTNQKANLLKVFQQQEILYLEQMKNISNTISAQVEGYFQRSTCLSAILNAPKRKEQKLQIFIQNFGNQIIQDLKELQENSHKFLDLKDLKLSHSHIQIMEMITTYQVNFVQAQQILQDSLRYDFEIKSIEHLKAESLENVNQQKSTMEFIKQMSLKMNNAVTLKLKQAEMNQYEIKFTQTINSLLLQQVSQQDQIQLKSYLDKFQQNSKTLSGNNTPKINDKFRTPTKSMTSKTNNLFTPTQLVNSSSFLKLKRIPLNITSICQNCNNKPSYKAQHEKCQSEYFLDWFGFVRCQKRIVSKPNEKICKMKYIMDLKLQCPYCKNQFSLDSFCNFLKSLTKELDFQELMIEEQDILQFLKKLYENFAQLYYKYALKRLNYCELDLQQYDDSIL